MTLNARKGGSWTHWRTPPDFLDLVRCVGDIGLDPCDHEGSHTRATASFYGPGDDPQGVDGLLAPWEGHGLVFVNPPYEQGAMPKWSAKMAHEGSKGVEIVALVPASTDAQWMHRYVFQCANAGVFWMGRIQFLNPPIQQEGKKNGSSVSNFVAYWGSHRESFFDAMDGRGELVRLRDPRHLTTETTP